MLPAPAGMSPSAKETQCLTSRAPRACGDEPRATKLKSPSRCVLPAPAGMSPGHGPYQPGAHGAPRACGDEPPTRGGSPLDILCSPRLRG